MHLVADQQVEEPLHPVLDVVGQRIAGRAGPVGLPEGRAAAGAGVLAAVQVGVRQRHAVLVHDLRRAVGAAGDAEGLPRLLLPYEPAPGRGPPLYHGGHPAVGQLGLLPAHHREEGAGADGEAEPLQVGDGLDDGGADAGHRHLHLPLPLGHQVGRADDEDALESRHVRRRRADEGLARAHLADDRGAPVGLEGEGRAPDGVGLRPQGLSEQPGERAAVLRGAVERRVGLHHPLGDGVLERVDEISEVHCVSPFLREHTESPKTPSSRRTSPPPEGGGERAPKAVRSAVRRPLSYYAVAGCHALRQTSCARRRRRRAASLCGSVRAVYAAFRASLRAACSAFASS